MAEYTDSEDRLPRSAFKFFHLLIICLWVTWSSIPSILLNLRCQGHCACSYCQIQWPLLMQILLDWPRISICYISWHHFWGAASFGFPDTLVYSCLLLAFLLYYIPSLSSSVFVAVCCLCLTSKHRSAKDVFFPSVSPPFLYSLFTGNLIQALALNTISDSWARPPERLLIRPPDIFKSKGNS